MKPMKLAAVLFVPMVSATGCEIYPARVTINSQEKVSLEGVRALYVETQNGSIEVAGDGDRADADVRAERFASGRDDKDARALAEKVTVEITRDPNRKELLRIVVRTPKVEMGRSCGASLTIKVPRDLSLQARSSNGRVQVANLSRPVDVKTSNGAVLANKVSGDLTIVTSNGRVEADDVTGRTDIHTSNGTVTVTNIRGEGLDVVTSNGGIRATQVRCSAKVQTSNGSVDLDLASLPEKPRVVASTTNGRVSVELPADVKASLRIHSTSGHVEARLDHANVADLSDYRSSVAATLNGGGGSIEVSTVNGVASVRTHKPQK